MGKTKGSARSGYRPDRGERKQKQTTVLEILAGWQASRSIERQREFQELIAALDCTYPRLLPQRYRDMSDEQILKRVEELKDAGSPWEGPRTRYPA